MRLIQGEAPLKSRALNSVRTFEDQVNVSSTAAPGTSGL